MQQDYDSSTSGYLVDSFEGISSQFTDVTILSTSDVNVVAKAKRYGRWWLLKGLNKKVANQTAYMQRLRKELELLTQLEHPLLVTTIGLEKVDDIGYCIVMEYVEVVINTARKEIIDEPSLVEALRKRTDVRYVADVKPDIADEIKAEFADRVFFTPKKMGAQTAEANINAGIAAAKQVVAFLKDGWNKYQVNK